MKILEDQLLIHELAERAGVSVRTIRYYIAEGLLPAPTTRGRYAYYSQEYLDLIELIRRLKEAYLPLREIRSLVMSLQPNKVREVLEESAGLPQEELLRSIRANQSEKLLNLPDELVGGFEDDTAASYSQRIMDQGAKSNKEYLPTPDLKSRTSSPPLRKPEIQDPFLNELEEPVQQPNYDMQIPSPAREDTIWRRYEVAPGVELNVQLTYLRKYKEGIAKLIQLARDLLKS